MKAENKILRTITDNRLLSEGDSVLVALSGGADSVALFYALLALVPDLKIKIYACHVHHGIRGVEADRDADFSKQLAEKHHTEFFLGKFDVPEYAKKMHISEEMAGRKLRYEFFYDVMKKNNIKYVATAHHKNDRVETILMNLIRGTGLKGFRGIEYKNGKIIRPILDLSKSEILEYCRECNVDYCTDSTNDEIIYKRNKIRHKLIPLFKEFNPDFDECIIRESDILSCDDDFIEKIAEKEYLNAVSEKGICISYIKGLHVSLKRRIIRKFITLKKKSDLDISYDDISNIIKLIESGKTGKEIMLGGKIKAVSVYGYIDIVGISSEKEFYYELKPEIPCKIEEIGKIFTLKKSDEKRKKLKIKAEDAVVIRSRKNGDIFCPVGMNGQKKVKDLLIDMKISRFERSKIPILTVNGDIASVVGIRDDRRYNDFDGKYVVVAENIREVIV